MKKPNFFQYGFSIMEVMLAAALLGVVSVGVLNVTKNMAKSSKADAQRMEYAQITGQIQSILRDEYSCEANLNGLSPQGAGSEVTAFKRKKSDGTTSNVFASNTAYGTGAVPIFLKKMEIKNYNAGSGVADFVVTMNKGRKDYASMTADEKATITATAYGSPTVSQTIKVQVHLDSSGKIKDCLSDKDDYTAGACGMLNGDWADKVKCRSINISNNGNDPAITANGHLVISEGLVVGNLLLGNPGKGNANFNGSIHVTDDSYVELNSTIGGGKLIFNNGDARINQVAGSNLFFENKAGTAGANIIAGRSGSNRTTVTPSSVTVNKNGTIGAGLALEVHGNTTLTGSGSTSVTLKVGNADIQYNGSNLVLNKPGAGVVQYRDGSTLEEVSTKGFVNAQLSKVLTGDPATLTQLLSNLSTLIGANPTLAISASVCGFYSSMIWNGSRCVFRADNCPANHMVHGFNNGGTLNCQPVVATNQSCGANQLFKGIDSSGNKICATMDSEMGAWVDQRIQASAALTAANATCQSKSASFAQGEGGNPGRCKWSISRWYYFWMPNCCSSNATGAACCSSYGAAVVDGEWCSNASNQYTNMAGVCPRSCSGGAKNWTCVKQQWAPMHCQLSADGRSCPGQVQGQWAP